MAADDDAIDIVSQHPDMFRFADAESDAERERGLGSQPSQLNEKFGRQLDSFAGDADDADAVEEPGRSGGDLLRPLRRRGRRDELDQFEVALLRELREIGRLLHRQIGNDGSREAGLLGLFDELRRPAMVH